MSKPKIVWIEEQSHLQPARFIGWANGAGVKVRRIYKRAGRRNEIRPVEVVPSDRIIQPWHLEQSKEYLLWKLQEIRKLIKEQAA